MPTPATGLLGRLRAWLRGDRFMVDSRPPDPVVAAPRPARMSAVRRRRAEACATAMSRGCAGIARPRWRAEPPPVGDVLSSGRMKLSRPRRSGSFPLSRCPATPQPRKRRRATRRPPRRGRDRGASLASAAQTLRLAPADGGQTERCRGSSLQRAGSDRAPRRAPRACGKPPWESGAGGVLARRARAANGGSVPRAGRSRSRGLHGARLAGDRGGGSPLRHILACRPDRE
jgi:hypothetical protein